VKQIFGVVLSLFNEKPENREWVVACLEGAWPTLVGERLAAVCKPVSFNGAELVVKMRDHAWEDAIADMKPALLKKLQTATQGKISAISLI
jgi:hypothetical protein